MKDLCCQIKPKGPCTICKAEYCADHLYEKEEAIFTTPSLICLDCYDKRIRKPNVLRKRKGMSFKELYLAVRQLIPHNYISVDVSINDHHPGTSTPNMEWTIYISSHNAFYRGEKPEIALNALRKALELPPLEEKKEQIDV